MTTQAATVDYILELGVEEIPAGYFRPAIKHIKERLEKELLNNRLPFSKMEVWGGPRRLALGLWNLSSMQPDVEEEVIGPPLSSAFDSNGNPTKAAMGFAKGQGVTVADIITVNTAKGAYLAVRKSLKGKPAEEILQTIIPTLLGSLPFPKVMRWGTGDHQFVRPVHWLLSVLGGEILPLTFAGIKAGKVSYGHRFLYPGAVVITSPEEYVSRLAETHVLIDFEKRRQMVLQEIENVVRESSHDLSVVRDDDLVAEVTNLVEEPAAILGHFDSQFLDLPLAVAATAMKEHQRYFPITDSQGRQAPYFVAINNTRARNMDVVRRGHERVLRARLEDARFYYEEDKKIALADRANDLAYVVFHHHLGSYQEKVERVRALSLVICQDIAPELQKTLARAATLSKCDLVTGVVKEFPSLQGTMGREYALKQGETQEVADAICEHYLPNRKGGPLPATTAGAILAIADKMDTICGCFSVGVMPTGTADPLALRRQALGILLIILERTWAFSLEPFIDVALASVAPMAKRPLREVKTDTMDFFTARLKSHILSLGISADGADAVLSLHSATPLFSVLRAQALEDLKKQDGFRDLAQTFKRVVNIIRKFGGKEATSDLSLLTQAAELNLLNCVIALENQQSEYLKSGSFKQLLGKIVNLKAPVDAFFEDVLVDDPNPALKASRIALLNRTSRLFELIADFSRISTV
ncbi:MAG: glycine--tRNA ligase subunit beta [Deltaproteobacteria bacterium]|jgi:glycyl-tRNA synthetase beta chain|nr:glycine--tRNA ligase subunit beta [Deltaproteobacteria bacterium]